MAESIVALRTLVHGFFRWWFSELASLVPSRFTRLLRRGQRMLVVDVTPHGVVFRACAAGRCQTLGLAEPGDEAAGAAVRALIRKAELDDAAVAVRVPEDDVLLKTLVLPQAAEPDLDAALPFQIDRHTPFAAEEVYFDYRIVERRREGRKLVVELAVAPRVAVDRALQTAAAWGLTPTIVDVFRDEEQGPGRFNLIVERGAPASRWSPANTARAAVAAALVAAAVYLPLYQQGRVLRDLGVRVAAARAEAEEAARLKRQLDRLVRDDRFLAKRKRAAGSLLTVLDELTRLLPDDTWLSEFQARRGAIQVSGYSPGASTLVGLIDNSPLFARPRFRSSLTRDAGTGVERFSLSFDMETRQP